MGAKYSDQPAIPQFILQKRIVNGRSNQARDAKRGFQNQHREKHFPGLGPDVAADDARIEEVLELVDRHEKRERSNRPEQRQGELRGGRTVDSPQAYQHSQQVNSQKHSHECHCNAEFKMQNAK